LATASRVRAWLAVEQPGPWGPDALTQSRLDPDLGAALARRGQRSGVRTILVRRPRPARASARPRCFLAHSGRRQSWVRFLDVDHPAELLDLDWSLLASDQAPALGTPVGAPVFLVCTNGRHDRCCADLGRPLVRALVAARVGQVWECSHIGGDRFAANVVCLPEGVYLGRVGAGEGPAVLRDYAAGHLSLDHYRGRSCYPALVQAAESSVRRAAGLTELHGLALIAVDALDGDRADVTFARSSAPDQQWRARVGRARSPAARLLTCRAGGEARPWAYHLEELISPT